MEKFVSFVMDAAGNFGDDAKHFMDVYASQYVDDDDKRAKFVNKLKGGLLATFWNWSFYFKRDFDHLVNKLSGR